MNIKNILQHYSSEEQKFVKDIYNNLSEVYYKSISKKIGFSNIREIEIIETLNKSFNNFIYIEDSYIDCELKYIMISSSTISSSNIVFYEIEYNSKFNTLEHRHVMGTLLNSGINKNTLGDIIINKENKIEFCCDSDISNILEYSIPIINNVKVTFKSINSFSIINDLKIEKIFIVSSQRIDTLLKNVIKVRRQKIQDLIKNGDVNVNYATTKSSTHQLKENDIISIRGFGKYKILNFANTKKKLKVNILIF